MGDSASLAVWDSPKPEGGLNVKCWASCDRRTIIGALGSRNTGFRIWDAWEGSGPPWEPPATGYRRPRRRLSARNRPFPRLFRLSRTSTAQKWQGMAVLSGQWTCRQ